MSDILEDQKIAYIVKDYKRMFDRYDAVVKRGKELEEAVKARDALIVELRGQINSQKNEIANLKGIQNQNPDKRARGVLNQIECRANAVYNHLKKTCDSLEGITKDVDELRSYINL